MAYDLIGKDFLPPDVHAKVTGSARYAEDFKVEGMLYSRLLTSPVPHARVRNIDVSAALEIDGVIAVMTADDVPRVGAAQNPILTNNPRYVGDPILAVAATSEQIAEDAVAAIQIDFERLPFTIDPLDSLRPGGNNAHVQGNIGNSTLQEDIHTLRWTEQDFADAGDGLPLGESVREWSVGDLDTGFCPGRLCARREFCHGQ